MSEAAYVIHFVRGLAPGHTPLCGAESSMGSVLPQLVTCPACLPLRENAQHAPARATAEPPRSVWEGEA